MALGGEVTEADSVGDTCAQAYLQKSGFRTGRNPSYRKPEDSAFSDSQFSLVELNTHYTSVFHVLAIPAQASL